MDNRCVYVWINDNTNEPFYVGCGTKYRAKTTKWGSRTKAFYDIYSNYPCHYEILFDNLTPEHAAELERKTIKEYREKGYPLVNQTNGGEIRQYGRWTDEMRKEYAERLTGENNPNYGHNWSDELKRQVSRKCIEEQSHAGGRNGRAKPVMCVETGVVYACKKDAADFLGVADATSSIWFCLQNPRRVAGKGKYHFVGKELFEELNSKEKRKEWLEKIAS